MTQFAVYKGRQPPGSRYNEEIKKRGEVEEVKLGEAAEAEEEEETSKDKCGLCRVWVSLFRLHHKKWQRRRKDGGEEDQKTERERESKGRR
ncbi:hypothetical protein MGYG_08929 [Nannizzia gypsea CBS 118893]|uniref:Uncharacterized protein n=1 Tax=Arthroderma gypseum (strain ATCC MYA-4604 / CBS 118893) TaxID=535722 RepID=E5R0L0_ARTGP|nr:hypothetical protein MGYG_08929 [Nannizzia gypsea CBS 118893]EFQ98354.1 hypothetical protein MGYG_08929 [Nannizzia gypsea CBS 118893]